MSNILVYVCCIIAAAVMTVLCDGVMRVVERVKDKRFRRARAARAKRYFAKKAYKKGLLEVMQYDHKKEVLSRLIAE